MSMCWQGRHKVLEEIHESNAVRESVEEVYGGYSITLNVIKLFDMYYIFFHFHLILHTKSSPQMGGWPVSFFPTNFLHHVLTYSS